MTRANQVRDTSAGFPRHFSLGRYRLKAYQVFLCVGIYSGTLISAAAAAGAGVSPLRMGVGILVCILGGLVGARAYHLVVFAPHYMRDRSWAALWDARQGGWSLFGGLGPIILLSFPVARALGVPVTIFWDFLAAGLPVGAACTRLGCVLNGCCGGRETSEWYGITLHDVGNARKRRIPVQFLEIVWWFAGGCGLLVFWTMSLPPGTYGLGIVTWYGVGRVWLEVLREAPDVLFGRIRINQVMAALLAAAAGGGLLWYAWLG